VVKAEGIHALAFIPLVMRGRLIGKFMTYHNTPYRFSDDARSVVRLLVEMLLQD
jgi:GAF domain-containing protein